MKIFLKKTLKVFILLFLLGSGALSFFHSELGLFAFDTDQHGAHDYCEIIKNTNTHKPTVIVSQPNLVPLHILCPHCLNESLALLGKKSLFNSNNHEIPKYSTSTYLFNATFLI